MKSRLSQCFRDYFLDYLMVYWFALLGGIALGLGVAVLQQGYIGLGLIAICATGLAAFISYWHVRFREGTDY